MKRKSFTKAVSAETGFVPCALGARPGKTLKISVIMKWLETEYDKAFIFVTLTAPNVRAEEFTAEIDKYNLAFKN